MSTIGVFLGLLIMGQPFGIVMTGIGVIALAGVVVNNNIVLIDTYDHLRRERAATSSTPFSKPAASAQGRWCSPP
jgi:multidrug efflux pump subunit AcrB